jgi:hypothetical protein
MKPLGPPKGPMKGRSAVTLLVWLEDLVRVRANEKHGTQGLSLPLTKTLLAATIIADRRPPCRSACGDIAVRSMRRKGVYHRLSGDESA